MDPNVYSVTHQSPFEHCVSLLLYLSPKDNRSTWTRSRSPTLYLVAGKIDKLPLLVLGDLLTTLFHQNLPTSSATTVVRIASTIVYLFMYLFNCISYQFINLKMENGTGG